MIKYRVKLCRAKAKLSLIGVYLSVFLSVFLMCISLNYPQIKTSYAQSKRSKKKKKIRYKGRKGKAGLRWIKIPSGRIKRDDLQLNFDQSEPDSQKVYAKKWIRVPSFLMTQTEITVAQYRRCVHAKVCPKPDSFLLEAECTWSDQPKKNENKPLNCISREDALIFAKWVGGGLPSHAQWYHAAQRGRIKRKKKTSTHTLIDQEWVGYKDEEGPFDVAQKKPNRLGLYDLLGNVSELVTLPKTHPHQDDDMLPCGCESIHFRGAMWSVPPKEVDESIWNGINVDQGMIGVGFRLVKSR